MLQTRRSALLFYATEGKNVSVDLININFLQAFSPLSLKKLALEALTCVVFTTKEG